MSFTYIGIGPGGRSGTFTARGVFTERIRYLFESDDQSDNGFDLLSHANCPKVGWTHPSHPFCWVQNISFEQYGGWKQWEVSASYSSEYETTEDPLDMPAAIDWGGEQFQEPLIVDVNGDLVLNSAGDPFDPPIMKDFSRRVVTVVKNLAAPPSWLVDSEDVINDSDFTLDGVTIPARCAKMQSVHISRKNYQNGVQFRQVTMLMHLNKRTWKFRQVDSGFNELYNTTDRIKIQINGEYPTAPVLLDGSGVRLSDPTPTSGVFLEFDGYPEVDFAATFPLT